MKISKVILSKYGHDSHKSLKRLQFGNVTDTHIPRQPGNPALNKGYGFVSFDNEVDVIRVCLTIIHKMGHVHFRSCKFHPISFSVGKLCWTVLQGKYIITVSPYVSEDARLM